MKTIITILLLAVSSTAFAQADSTNLPGLGVSVALQTGAEAGPLPDIAALDPNTVYTETQVQACPSTGGNGYGYYPNGSVPTDGSDTTQQINGGVVYDQTVTTDRFGTTTYSGWTEVNFLCTAIPVPPHCPTGQTQIATPSWDWNTNQWTGLQCQAPTRVCQYQPNYQTGVNNGNQSYISYVTDNNDPRKYVSLMWNGTQYPPVEMGLVPTSSFQGSQGIVQGLGFDYGATTPSLTFVARGSNQTTNYYPVCKIN
ncbi:MULTISPECIES: hypothetical protein [Burkholderia]|uniref:hypothetical protein n=1 Tax=Burkholderia TaxID=32008 RepID=UPI00117E0FB2|nr:MULTISPECIES: hypothetical protein [Burkholderia]